MASNVDRGYAWVVLVASFAIDMITGLLMTSVGILTTAMVDEIDRDITRVSWVSSTLLGTSTLFGPLAGLIQDRIGHRLTGIVSGILILIGLTAASFCQSVPGLVLTFGIISGLGAGLAVNLSGVAPGSYFVKKLPIAYGVIQAGGGVGLFVVGPLTVLLLDLYNLHGTLLILGGIGFHVCLAGALIRPNAIRHTQEQDVMKPLATEDSELCDFIKSKTGSGLEDHELTELAANSDYDAIVSCRIGNSATAVKEELDTRAQDVTGASVVCLKEDSSATGRDDDMPGDGGGTSHQHQYDKESHWPSSREKEANGESALSEPMLERDSTDDRHSVREGIPSSLLIQHIKNAVSVLSCNGFHLYLLSGFFWSVGESSCMVHLPNYVESKGSTPTQSGTLLTGMGITSVMSGVLSGFAASDPVIGNILLNFGYLGISGLLCLLFPLFSYSYPLQMVFSLLYGIYSQAPYTLAGPICIELVGLSNLAVAYGLSAFSLGLGYLIGSPVAGFLYEFSGNYDYTFIFAGCSILVGTVMVALVPIYKSKTYD